MIRGKQLLQVCSGNMNVVSHELSGEEKCYMFCMSDSAVWLAPAPGTDVIMSFCSFVNKATSCDFSCVCMCILASLFGEVSFIYIALYQKG